MANSSIKLAVLCSHPIQYFAPLYRNLAGQAEIDLTVFYCSKQGAEPRLDPGFGQEVRWDIPLLQGYNYQFLPNQRRADRVGGFFSLINPAIIGEIRRGQWNALLMHGYFYATNWLAILAARTAGVPVLMRGESHLLDKRPLGRSLAKKLVLRHLFRLVDAALYIGTHNRAFYRHYGIPEEKLFFTPYAVDNDFFRQEATRLGPRRRELRQKFGVPDDRPLILFCGKLIPKKQPLLLLEAYASVRQEHPCALLFAGDGPLRGEVERATACQNIADVHISGFLNQREVSQAYVAADIMVLPSAWEETWGLVLNEAMNFALPVVATDRVGGALDLIREGENGFVVPHNNAEVLARALKQIVKDSFLRIRLGLRSREIIQGWGLREVVQGITQASSNLGIRS